MVQGIDPSIDPGIEPPCYAHVAPDDVDAIADLYVTCFPHLASRWFRNPRHASALYRDLFDLLRVSDHRTFLVARVQGRTVGAAIVVRPQLRLSRALLRERRWLKVLRQALAGHYGFSPAVFLRALRAIIAGDRDDLGGPFEHRPHLYLLAVHPRHAGRGVGRGLMNRVDEACDPTDGSQPLWLFVERDNERAIRFYQGIGFQIAASNQRRHVMTRPTPMDATSPS